MRDVARVEGRALPLTRVTMEIKKKVLTSISWDELLAKCLNGLKRNSSKELVTS